MSTSIWIKPSGIEIEVDEGSAIVAANLGWKRKELKQAAPVAVEAGEQKRKGRPRIKK